MPLQAEFGWSRAVLSVAAGNLLRYAVGNPDAWKPEPPNDLPTAAGYGSEDAASHPPTRSVSHHPPDAAGRSSFSYQLRFHPLHPANRRTH